MSKDFRGLVFLMACVFVVAAPEKNYAQADKTETEVRRLFLTGLQNYLKRDFSAAANIWDKVIKMDPTYRKAKEYMEKAWAKSSDMATYYLLGAKAQQKSEFCSALDNYNVTLRINPQYKDTRKRAEICRKECEVGEIVEEPEPLILFLTEDFIPVIVDIKYDEKKDGVRQYVELSWSVKSNEEGISGYSYALQKDRFKVPGTNILSKERKAVFDVLENGEYYFSVRAMSKENLWGDYKSMHFTITLVPLFSKFFMGQTEISNEPFPLDSPAPALVTLIEIRARADLDTHTVVVRLGDTLSKIIKRELAIKRPFVTFAYVQAVAAFKKNRKIYPDELVVGEIISFPVLRIEEDTTVKALGQKIFGKDLEKIIRIMPGVNKAPSQGILKKGDRVLLGDAGFLRTGRTEAYLSLGNKSSLNWKRRGKYLRAYEEIQKKY